MFRTKGILVLLKMYVIQDPITYSNNMIDQVSL